MKKVVPGWILLFLGAFFLVVALLLITIGTGMTHRTPLNVDSSTYLSGQAKKLNPATGEVEDVPVKVLNKTKVDPKKSDDDVVVFVSYSCVNIDRDDPPPCLTEKDQRLITNSVDTFATDRHTGVAVNDAKYQNSKSEDHEGLVNKFPFDTQKKTYEYWDGLLGETVPAKYVQSEKVQGLPVYKFEVNVPKTEAKIAGEVEGTYQAEKSIWVEPKTGAIVDQEQHEERLLPDGSTVLDMSLSFTSKTVSDGVKDAKDNVNTLNLSSRTLPIVGGVVGLLALIAGVLLLRGGRGSRARA